MLTPSERLFLTTGPPWRNSPRYLGVAKFRLYFYVLMRCRQDEAFGVYKHEKLSVNKPKSWKEATTKLKTAFSTGKSC